RVKTGMKPLLPQNTPSLQRSFSISKFDRIIIWRKFQSSRNYQFNTLHIFLIANHTIFMYYLSQTGVTYAT
ncbi:MAG: hypothetical protein ABI947_10730, partial [Chloroflexota bacterium]